MTKDAFLDQLSYGVCTGSVEVVSPKCVDGNPGKKYAICPVKVADRLNAEELCNCCDQCRNNCAWMGDIKIANRRASKKQLRELVENLGLDNE